MDILRVQLLRELTMKCSAIALKLNALKSKIKFFTCFNPGK